MPSANSPVFKGFGTWKVPATFQIECHWPHGPGRGCASPPGLNRKQFMAVHYESRILNTTVQLAMNRTLMDFTMQRVHVLFLGVAIFVSANASLVFAAPQRSNGGPVAAKKVQRIDSLNGHRVDSCLYWQHGDTFVYMSFLHQVSVARKDGDKYLVQKLDVDSPGWICDCGDSLVIGVGQKGTSDYLFAPAYARIQVFDNELKASKTIEIPESNESIDFVSCVQSAPESTVLFCATSKLERKGGDVVVSFEQQLIRIRNTEATVIHRSQPFVSKDGRFPVFAVSGDDIIAIGLQADPIIYRSVGKYLDLRFDVRWFHGSNGMIDLAPIKSPDRASCASNSSQVAFISDDQVWTFDPGSDRVAGDSFNAASLKDVALFDSGNKVLLVGDELVALPFKSLAVSGALREHRISADAGVYHRCAIDTDGNDALCGTILGFLHIVQLP